jgi:hypothetical protein
MPVMSLTQLVVTVLSVLVAALLSHLFTRFRDRDNRRREQRIDYLVSAFRGLAKANHHPRLHEIADDLEQAVVDIQLFGSPKQIELARRFATALGTTQEADMDDLLNELRDSLRQELGRKKVSGNLVWLKIGRGKEKAD